MFIIRDNRFFLITMIAVIALFTVACDKNIARPEDLAALTSVSVDELTVGSQTLIAGEDGTTICWKVTDDEDVLQKVELATDDGSSHTVAEEDCEGINPDHSTMYSVNAYVDGEIAKTKSVYVKVLSDDGSEITETPNISLLPESETVCDDGDDEDGDDATDCDDPDCAADDVCYVAPTYEFTSGPSFDPQAPLIGDPVKVTWESTFEKIIIYKNGILDPKVYDATDSYELTASGSDTIVLQGLVQGGPYASAQLDITATSVAPKDFEGEFTSFKATPSSGLIAGDTYVISWEVSNARTAQMGSYTGLVNATDPITATDGSQTYTLTAIDNNGNSDSRSLTVSASGFSSPADVMGTVSDVQPGAAAGEYYFAGKGGIFYTTDSLATAPVELTTGGVSGDILTLAVDGDKMYVGTAAGVYFRSGTEGDFAEILTTGGSAEVHSIAILGNGSLLVGTDEVLYEVGSDHVLIGAKDFAGRETTGDYSRDPIDFVRLIHKSAESSVLIAIADFDGSKTAYLSTDGGTTFASTDLDGITGGFAPVGAGASTFVWSESKVYEYQSSDSSFAAVEDLNGVNGIRFATESGGRYFAATEDGVVCGYDGGWFTTDFTDSAAFVLGSASSSVVAVTDSGEQAALSFSGAGTRIFNNGLRPMGSMIMSGGPARVISF